VVLIDSEGHYAGIVQIPRVYGDGVKPETDRRAGREP
jgi:CIC family chloride channel protein